MSGQELNSAELAKKNRKVLRLVFLLVIVMLGLAYLSVPLYSIFCRVTGFGGTTQVSEKLPDVVLEREILVRFDTNTASDLQWDFKSEVKDVVVKVGARGFINFIAHNRSNVPVTGTAVFNVTPLKAGKYFQKIQCFCFTEQTLDPNETMHMPVLFYIDPAIENDPNMKDVTVITLSYSFFRNDSPELEDATQKFYESQL